MKIAVIGAGASGIVFAVSMKKLDKKTEIVLFERNNRVGKKILATGNGKCNLTNMNISPEFYRNYDFARFALEKHTPESNIRFFNSIGLFTKTDAAGRVYPMSGRAESVLDLLRTALDFYGVKVLTDTFVDKIKKSGNGYEVMGEHFDKVVVCVGGCAGQNQGTDGTSYGLLTKFGHRITRLAPSLVQLVTASSKYPKQLQGLRCDAILSFTDEKGLTSRKRGELLFTSYGLSGIVSMEISVTVSPFIQRTGKNAVVYVDFLPDLDFAEFEFNCEKLKKSHGELPLDEMMKGYVSGKIGECILKEASLPQKMKISGCNANELVKLFSATKAFPFVVSGTKDFPFAQVTNGGFDTREFNPKTMESKKQKGLYAIGEALDVDGDCGGYNLNWAWSSARLCSESIYMGIEGN